MIKMLIALLIFDSAVESFEDDATDATQDILDSATVRVRAKVITRHAPNYPRAELRKGKEAWSRVAFCIDESGHTRNISILDSVGGENFDNAALQTVSEWQYEPALINGEPSWQSRNQVYITFALSGEPKGATAKFGRQFRKLGKLIDEKQLPEADKLFWRLHDTYDLSLYELAKLWAQRVRYEGQMGNFYLLNKALHRATASDGEWIDKKSYIYLLKIRTQVEVHLGKYHSALKSFEKITAAAGESADEVQELMPKINELKTLIDSDQTLSIPAVVKSSDECNYCNDSWHFTPVRRSFSLEDIDGALSSIVMRCDNKRFESDVSDLVDWNIPHSWGTCHVNIYGDPGTTFNVVLLPDAPVQ